MSRSAITALGVSSFLVFTGCHNPTLKQDQPPAVPETVDEKEVDSPKQASLKTQPAMSNPGKSAPSTKPQTVGNSRELDIKYPLGRTITDSEGKAIRVKIIGKDSESLFVIRQSDGSPVTFPLSKLSAKDQAFSTYLPIKPPPPLAKRGPNSNEAAYLAIRENDLKRMKQQARAMQKGLVVNRKKLLIKRGIEGRLKILGGQILALEQQLRAYKVSRGIPVK